MCNDIELLVVGDLSPALGKAAQTDPAGGPNIVNTARGEVIDEDAMVRLISDGKIAGAGLDVFEREPMVNPKLLRLARADKVVRRDDACRGGRPAVCVGRGERDTGQTFVCGVLLFCRVARYRLRR